MTKADAPTPPERATDWACWRDPSHDTWKHALFGWPSCRDCGASPRHHDRLTHLPDDLTVGIYLPAPDSTIAELVGPRSALVGLPEIEDLSTRVYFDTRANPAPAFPTQTRDRQPSAAPSVRELWEAGIEHAATRMVTRHPTLSQRVAVNLDLIRIGTYWPATRHLDLTDEAALTAWLTPTS